MTPPVNLVVVAHPDDEILGFGATGAKLVAAGEIVQPIILCGNVDARTQRPTDERLMADIAAATGLTREGLYKTFSKDGNPSFGTVLKVMKALGLKLKPEAA